MNSLNHQALALAEKFGLNIKGDELITALKNTAFKTKDEISDEQMMSLLIVANQHNLNPWTKEIYAFPDKSGIVPIVGVDGWSRIINSHPQFDGLDFEQDAESCTCIIYRKDRSHPIKVTEWLEECRRPPFEGVNQKTNKTYKIDGPWQSHPKRMLRHKAMIQCARLAFSFTGIYDQDEAERIVESSKPQQPAGMTIPEITATIQTLETAAKNGKEHFIQAWGVLDDDTKNLIGIEEFKRIKAMMAINAEYTEVPNDQ
ncbi:phage recombination protein Bet [Wohlfahrtiimonas chitiniclastica]|uniref:phage recombination protein Bet n=1 Tax=Wohlfahrtiimonas chitiniclastica TaxID=400946 RepID=UPI000B98216F|nr:phage recombination protein Bet [Wohlfahrtiimonas chitiniclastica]OYQ86659.1 phage recombination protein Bet [Wohlfahrtiimonas chitiniclastica]